MSAATAIDFAMPLVPHEAPPQPAAVVDAEAFLVRRLRAGDEHAWASVTRANGARMLGAARRILAADEDAREAVQEAWLHAFRALARFEGQSQLSTWLHRIAVNAALMKLRAQRRRPEAPLDELPPYAAAGGEPAADRALARGEDVARVRRAIDRLPARHRDVLALRDLDELDTEQTAQRLGITPGAVKTRLHRARQALREELEREHDAVSAACADVAAGRAA
jgi:RNA polymerase sigma-70 factor (ECF subfamily)